MSRLGRILLIGLAAAFVVVQLVPVSRSNPPETGSVSAPVAARAVLERACFDCHSHRTNWPWYAYIAPASWLVTRDVERARRAMNLSRWPDLSPRRRARLPERMIEEIERGNMPPRLYRFAHPKSRIRADDLAALRAWTDSVENAAGSDGRPPAGAPPSEAAANPGTHE